MSESAKMREITRSVTLPAFFWDFIEIAAKANNMTVDMALGELVMRGLDNTPDGPVN